MTGHRPYYLLLGNCHADEFRNVVAFVAGSGSSTQQPDQISRVDCVLFLQSFPGQFAPALVDQLRRQAPLTRMLLVAGAWSEGEMRTGRPLTGVERCAVANAVARLKTLSAGRYRPATSTVADDVLRSFADFTSGSGIIVLAAMRKAERTAISLALREAGFEIAVGDDLPVQPGLWIVAGDDIRDSFTLATAERLHARFPLLPGVAILGGPRSDEIALLRQRGVRHVLSKPFLLADLIHLLDQLA